MEAASLAAPLRLRESVGTRTPQEPTDVELLLAVAKGSTSAFEELYRRYVQSVFGLALRKLGDRGHAEETAQEVFAAIWRSAHRYRPERGSVPAWLYTIARNAIVDRARGKREPPVEGGEDEPSLEPGPPERAERDWVSWRVHAALAQLPEREREAIELAYWSGLSQSEIAERLELPLGTVKTRTRSGLQRLAGLLGEEMG